jgi:ribulose-phosphate 3-epimerase
MRVGLALSPGTPASAAHALADAGLLDLVLVMTVTPGFGGQPFQESELAKVRELRQRYPALDLQVDGGLAPGRTVAAAAAAGANVVVAGSAIFGAPDAAAAISALREALLA